MMEVSVSKIDLTNDQLQAETRECLVEIERRLGMLGRPRLLARAKRAHAMLSDVEESLHECGQIAARSIGGDKGD
jgi:hypothetical protein